MRIRSKRKRRILVYLRGLGLFRVPVGTLLVQHLQGESLPIDDPIYALNSATDKRSGDRRSGPGPAASVFRKALAKCYFLARF